MPRSNWYEDTCNVCTLGFALVEAGFDAEQLQAYYEKPWKWTDEWEAFLAGGQKGLEEKLEGA